MTAKGDLFLALAALIAVLAYGANCLFRPYAACRSCKGDGKFRSTRGKSWRKCRRCKGGGERKRLGRVVADWIIRDYRKHHPKTARKATK